MRNLHPNLRLSGSSLSKRAVALVHPSSPFIVCMCAADIFLLSRNIGGARVKKKLDYKGGTREGREKPSPVGGFGQGQMELKAPVSRWRGQATDRLPFFLWSTIG